MNASRQELPKNQHQAAAAALRTSEQTGIGGPPLSDTYPGLTVNDAYAIQMININGRVDAGAVIVGHKVGLTAKAMQVLLGVDEPDFGHILDDMVHPSGGTLVIDGFLQPRVEPEIAFRLGRPLRGPNVTVADVLAATDAVCASLEIVDSRIADWKLRSLTQSPTTPVPPGWSWAQTGSQLPTPRTCLTSPSNSSSTATWSIPVWAQRCSVTQPRPSPGWPIRSLRWVRVSTRGR
jgi:hypothetical protein